MGFILISILDSEQAFLYEFYCLSDDVLLKIPYNAVWRTCEQLIPCLSAKDAIQCGNETFLRTA